MQISVREHLRRIRQTEPGDRRWGWSHQVESPPDIHLPASWLALEFPELARRELDPLMQYFLGGQGTIGRRAFGRLPFECSALTAFFLWFFYLHYILMLVALFKPLMASWPPLFILLVLLPVAFVLYREIGNPTNVLPRTPMEILATDNRQFIEDFTLTPVSDRDLFVGSVLLSFRKRRRMPPLLRLVFLYGLFIGVPLMVFRDANAAIAGSAFAAYLDFRRECFLGASARRHGVLAGILPVDAPDPRMRHRFGRRIYNKAMSRRKAQAAAIQGARFIHNLPLGLSIVLLVIMLLTGIMEPLMMTLMAIPALALFVLARSPAPLYFHRASRYVTQWRLRFFLRHMNLHRQFWTRLIEEGETDSSAC